MAAKSKPTMKIEVGLIALNEVQHYERNARTHPQTQIEEIKASIREFGFTNAALIDVDDANLLAAGHGRHMALEQMYDADETVSLWDGRPIPSGYMPFIDCSAWTPEQRRAYTLADNKIAENSGWDEELLKIELGELLEIGADAAPIIGFSDAELEAFTGNLSGSGDGDGNYSRKIEAPVYEPKVDKPAISELTDTAKRDALNGEIDEADLPDDIAAFLRAAAERHTVFDFERIAEFYCHADAGTQALMEKSALVIIDFDKAVEGGFVSLVEAAESAWEADHGDAE